ncbi:uncharacterized protein LOC111272643 isoform X2 [Varroa jacobsoni]|uniref:uncharacterized protein LOC111272643 isoform X2 n=1 Tax=Varroa jacobsoni TaxID=62625 RepID=UPI000BFA0674|nr:uncharacterized protein LOC111272643 isoform X2 [Varroa jacobsoni]
MGSPSAKCIQNTTVVAFVILLQLIFELKPSFSEARARHRQPHDREDKDLVAMRSVNTNFLYTLICDNFVSADTQLARYHCLLNGMTAIDRSALSKCVTRFNLRSNAEFISTFCRGGLSCKQFRHCIVREREALREAVGATVATKPTGDSLITAEPVSTAITTNMPPTTTTPFPTTATTIASPSFAVVTKTTEASTSSVFEGNATTVDAAEEAGRGDDTSSPAPPLGTSQPLQPEHSPELIDDEDDFFPCLCVKKAKYLKRSSKAFRQGRSLNNKDVELLRRQLENARLLFPPEVIRKCLVDFGHQPQGHTSVSSTSSLRKYYGSIFRPF